MGIDIGTTSVKAVAADADGTVVARARLPHRLVTGAGGVFEHDLDQAWRANVLEVLAHVATGHQVEAVEVSAMVPSLGAVGAAGAAVGPGLLYGDFRGAHRDADPSVPGDGGELLAFLAWHAADTPEALGYWPAQAAANHALSGRAAIDTTTAMTAYPLFDMKGWDEALAAEAGAPVAKLPDIVIGTEPAGRVKAELPAAGALVAGGTIDALAEQLVSGATEAGDVLVLCGTTLITWAVTDGWCEAPGLWSVPHTVPGLSLIGGPSNAGGLFLDQVRRWLGDGPALVAEAEAAATRTAATGAAQITAATGVREAADLSPGDLPMWLPYLRGERTPLHRRDLRASLHDLSLHHGPAHLLAAAYEASGFVVRHHLDLAASAPGVRPRRIVASGGGTRSGAWMQALADCTGLPVAVSAIPEGAALGAAFLARCTAGLEPDTAGATRWARTSYTVEPRRDWVDAAAGRYQRFRERTALL